MSLSHLQALSSVPELSPFGPGDNFCSPGRPLHTWLLAHNLLSPSPCCNCPSLHQGGRKNCPRLGLQADEKSGLTCSHQQRQRARTPEGTVSQGERTLEEGEVRTVTPSPAAGAPRAPLCCRQLRAALEVAAFPPPPALSAEELASQRPRDPPLPRFPPALCPCCYSSSSSPVGAERGCAHSVRVSPGQVCV